jgi:hypothetical protein
MSSLVSPATFLKAATERNVILLMIFEFKDLN